MASPQISKDGTWWRYIHDTWENGSGWRTDIPKSVLDNSAVLRAAFILDDKRALFVKMEELRFALQDCPFRKNEKIVGPFNVDPDASTINGRKINFEIRLPKKD